MSFSPSEVGSTWRYILPLAVVVICPVGCGIPCGPFFLLASFFLNSVWSVKVFLVVLPPADVASKNTVSTAKVRRRHTRALEYIL